MTDHREAVEAARRLAKHYDAYMADDESEMADDYPDIARELGGIVARALLSLSDRVEDARKEAIDECLKVLEDERQGYENLTNSTDSYTRMCAVQKEAALHEARKSLSSLLLEG
jgi:hypothetical protein